MACGLPPSSFGDNLPDSTSVRPSSPGTGRGQRCGASGSGDSPASSFWSRSGVGGVLILLLIPALQDARAAARRATCIDNLKQMGLALFNYQSANGVLPMSQVRGEGHGNGHSVFTIILPYLDEAPVYNGYNFCLENWHAANTSVVQAPDLHVSLPR